MPILKNKFHHHLSPLRRLGHVRHTPSPPLIPSLFVNCYLLIVLPLPHLCFSEKIQRYLPIAHNQKIDAVSEKFKTASNGIAVQ